MLDASCVHRLAFGDQAMTGTKIPITKRALIQRINRKLKPQYERMQSCRRNSRWWRDLGDLYVVDTYRNAIRNTHVDVEKYAREIGVLQPFEQVTEVRP
jgi:hypothetical protein